MGLQAFGLEAPFLLRVGGFGVGGFGGVGVGCYWTLVQYCFCARVSGWWFSDPRAVGALRACLILLVLGHSCSTVSACVSDFAYLRTLVQSVFCISVPCVVFVILRNYLFSCAQ